MEFRLYNKPNCSVFDLIGNKEPDQTKGLGYLLSVSSKAMELFLHLIFPDDKNEVLKLLKLRGIVDCELTQNKKNNKSNRADIVIRFYDGYKPYKAIVMEAKSAKGYISNINAATQITNYLNVFKLLRQFQGNDITLVTLTTVVNYNSKLPKIKSITWQEIRNAFDECHDKKTISNEIRLIRDYSDYINKIEGTMNYYDEEVLIIPAGSTIEYVRNPKCALYECPLSGAYKTRGEHHPLYVAFRERRHNGRITDLYKILDILSFDLDDTETIDALATLEFNGKLKYPNIKSRIEYYIQHNKEYSNGIKWVFIIDIENSIHLPFDVEYEGSIKGMAGITYRKLNEIIRKPEKGETVVKLKKKRL